MPKKAVKKPEPKKNGKKRKNGKKSLSLQQKRFVELYLGSDGGKCWSSATMSYLWAYYGDHTPIKDKDGNYTSEYEVSKTEGCRVLAYPCVKEYIDHLLSEVSLDPKNIKKGIAKWSRQEKNPVVALNALEKLAKITGVMKDDKKEVDLEQIAALTASIQSILNKK